ncbi:MAG: hypothetical protein A3F31_02465 [Candidatus Levybacteria bacterium RIFCSPHIGHO2_12_FULL_38_12]|nr:MAG: hypothetical protein A2770_01970 [Candidatus Levybacteria bacterium RIFCSPHIGHO2_01_FULL_38_12]OGH22740.1 MAG: hypothetical protein A3F31_02465 [Candidatus Levybacteria bacterium RIFCSPHIGHO2_12_FULL_38_12]OGH33494.1 MAG: hypothetical protein A3A47_01670 [Candidatus Levybacteria bacterium RIFCSPLOWO2_01_FULL_37_20]OGH44881.1 MAG: hypothetical protein A3J14_02620 [Candidatus Levybacteria bacterium RIFCSPLOWO2_02_FULL_37_18]OGH50377.1 MAG: hypothetical protein A3G13_00380 [Candidatus Levy
MRLALENIKSIYTEELTGATLKKRQMSFPDNMTDPATTGSLLESLALGIALRRARERNGLFETEVITSENARSAGPAVVIAKTLSVPISIQPL